MCHGILTLHLPWKFVFDHFVCVIFTYTTILLRKRWHFHWKYHGKRKHAFAMATFDQFFITSHSWQISCKIWLKKHGNFWHNSAMASFSFILDSNFLCFFTRAKFIIKNTAILDTNLPWQFFLFILDFQLFFTHDKFIIQTHGNSWYEFAIACFGTNLTWQI